MSKHNSTTGRVIQTAALYRASDDKQENSIDRQRAGVIPYAKHNGYAIVQEYVFDGVPGDEIGRHEDWKRLMRDALAGKWQVLLVDEPSRLSRDDPDDFVADVKRPLKRAGIRVDSVSRGILDWDTIAGDILTLVDSHKSRDEVKNLSRRVLAGMANLAKNGTFFGWICPYGLRIARAIDQDTGKIIDRKCVFGPEEEVRVVRFIFDAVANRGWSVRRVCRELEARAVKPPKGNGYGKNKTEGRWNERTVRKMLKNRKYVGDMPWNETHQGKYSRWIAGAVEQNGTISRGTSRNAEEDWIVVPDLIPPLIDRDLFVRAGLALAEGQKRTSPNGDNMRYLFTHMLVCGDCGSYMYGCPMPHNKGKGYICSKYKRFGACHRNRVFEKELFQAVLGQTLNIILDPTRLDRVEAKIKERLDAERSSGAPDRIRQQIAALDKDIAQGNANLARLPEDRLPGVVACLRQWEKDRQGMEAHLRELETGNGEDKRILDEARKQLWHLRQGLEGDDEELQATVIREVVSKIEIHFDHEETHGKRSKTGKKRLLSTAAKAVLYVRPGLGIVSLENSDLSKSGSRRCIKACQ